MVDEERRQSTRRTRKWLDTALVCQVKSSQVQNGDEAAAFGAHHRRETSGGAPRRNWLGLVAPSRGIIHIYFFLRGASSHAANFGHFPFRTVHCNAASGQAGQRGDEGPARAHVQWPEGPQCAPQQLQQLQHGPHPPGRLPRHATNRTAIPASCSPSCSPYPLSRPSGPSCSPVLDVHTRTSFSYPATATASGWNAGGPGAALRITGEEWQEARRGRLLRFRGAAAPPAKQSKKAALKKAVMKANGEWPMMSAHE